MPERLVICGGVRRAGGDSIFLSLSLSGRSQNISLKLEDISKKLIRNIPSLLVDLIEIATYVFCADQATSRGGEAQQAMGADWRRDFRFVIPVRNPGHWNRRNVLETLCFTLSFLSDDNYTFHFEKATNPAPIQNYLEFGGESDTGFKADEVVLFSGGLDSLGGMSIAKVKVSTGKDGTISGISSSHDMVLNRIESIWSCFERRTLVDRRCRQRCRRGHADIRLISSFKR